MGVPPPDPGLGIPSGTDGGDGDAILVVRSGGIAGMTRRWAMRPAGDDAAHWIGLVERCPWDDDPLPGSGADRFVWRIEARIGRVQRERVIPEDRLAGPWRDLVDAVRAADEGTASTR